MNCSLAGVKKEKIEKSIREVSSRDCAGCGEPTRTLYIFSCGVCWHKECFRCSRTSCRKVMKQKRAVIRDDEPFCSKLCADNKDVGKKEDKRARDSGGGDRCWQFNDKHYCKRGCSKADQPEPEKDTDRTPARGRERSRSRKRETRSKSQPRNKKSQESKPKRRSSKGRTSSRGRASSRGRFAASPESPENSDTEGERGRGRSPRNASRGRGGRASSKGRNSSKGRIESNVSPKNNASPKGRGRHISRGGSDLKMRMKRSSSQPRRGRFSKKGTQRKKTKESRFRSDFRHPKMREKSEVESDSDQIFVAGKKKSRDPETSDSAAPFESPPDFARMLSPDSFALYRKATKPLKKKEHNDNISSDMVKEDKPTDEDPEMCENCEENPAVISCEQCDEKQCTECETLMHRTAKKKKHNRTPIGNRQGSSSSAIDSSKDKRSTNKEKSEDDIFDSCVMPSKPPPKMTQSKSLPKKQTPKTQSSDPSPQPSDPSPPPSAQSSSEVEVKTEVQGYTTITTQTKAKPQTQNRMAKCCGFCRQPLTRNRKMIRVQGYICHHACFVCWTCKKEIGNNGYINRGRFFFCSLSCADEGVAKYMASQKKL